MKRAVFIIGLASVCLCVASLHAEEETINLRRTTTVRVVERTKAAVVYISTQKLMQQPVEDGDPFGQFFPQLTRNVPVGSLGSGFIVHPDGYIVTNNHVIDRARKILVTLSDKAEPIAAELISADSDSDLAILKVHVDHPLPTLELGDSADLMIGEPVIAIGNPLGYNWSVSTGIVSALDRTVDAQGEHTTLKNLIQTDSAINAGNSGGPLLNAYGQVIGINTAIAGDAQNIGFAIAVDTLRDRIPTLMDPVAVNKVEMPLKLQEHRTLKPPAGIICTVERVNADKPEPVELIAGKRLANIVDAYALMLAQKDKPFSLKLADGKQIDVKPEPAPLANAVVLAKSRLGIEVEQVTPMLAEQKHLATEDGVRVTKIEAQSVAAQARLRTGDIVLQLGQYRIQTLGDFGNLLERIPVKRDIYIVVLRDRTLLRGHFQL